jgi:hypothetical protein
MTGAGEGATTGGVATGGCATGAALAIVMLNAAGPTLPPAPSEIVNVKLSLAAPPAVF